MSAGVSTIPTLVSWHEKYTSDWDFPAGPVVKNLPTNAKDTGSIPAWGTKIPHAWGPCSATREATTRESHMSQQRLRGAKNLKTSEQ